MLYSFLKKFQTHGWIGISFVAVFWYLNWNLEGLRTNILFFPLWLGYILTVDAIVYLRKGTSLFTRSKKKFISLFLISAPAWWLFELINWQTQNWFYDGRQFFTNSEYALLATISFSTVIPAVFSTAELVSTFKWTEKFKLKKQYKINRATLLKMILAGIIMLGLIMLFPKYFYYLEWTAVYFIIDPINYKLKNHSLLGYIEKGNWKPVIALSAGALICGFFWEMWNYYSYPKWIYNTPMVNFLHVFEMPLAGYIGYIPFAWELSAIYNFTLGITKRISDKK
jgi:hypothetical protein